MWATRSRLRRPVAAVAAVLVALLAVGLLFPTDVWRVELDGDGLTLAFLQAAGEEPVLADDFSESTGAWNERREASAVVDVRGGALHVRLTEEGTFDYEAPHATVGELPGVHVEVSARVVSGGPAAVVGLFCAVSGGPGAELVGSAGGYVFFVHPQSRVVRLGRVPAPLQSGFAKAAPLDQGRLPDPWPLGARKTIAADCEGASGTVAFFVDGDRLVSAPARAGDRAYDSAGVVVLHVGGARETAVEFDDYVVRARER